MTPKYFNHSLAAALIGLAAAGMAFTSCSDDIDSPARPDAPEAVTYRMAWDGSIKGFEGSDDDAHESRAAINDYSTWANGSTVLVFDSSNNPLGRAVYSSSTASWDITITGSASASGTCTAVYAPNVTDFANTPTYIFFDSHYPIFLGQGEYMVIDGVFRLSLVLEPVCARVRFTADSAQHFSTNCGSGIHDLADNSNFVISTYQSEVMAGDWARVNGQWSSPYVYVLSSKMPRVRVGENVYRYRADSREITPGMSICLTLGGKAGSETTWASAPHVSYTSTMARKNIYGSVTYTLMSQTLESAIGFLMDVDYLWTPYGSMPTQSDSNLYPFGLKLNIDGETYDYHFCEIEGTSGTEWSYTSGSLLEGYNSIGNIQVVPSGGNDVWVTISSFKISNF